MREFHEGPLGSHFAIEITQKKILDVGYWWPTLYRDVHDYSDLVMHAEEQADW
jgi:hypothetical protein